MEQLSEPLLSSQEAEVVPYLETASQKQKIKCNETLAKFQQFINQFTKDNDKKEFTVKQAVEMQVYNIINLWSERPFKRQKCQKYILNLYLINPKVPYGKIKDAFEFYPSIKVYYNQERIENNGVLRYEGDYFYQGNSKFMKIYSEIRSTDYRGQVTETFPHLPHGKGVLQAKKDGFFYQGSFMEGKYHGQGDLRTAKNVRYIGNFKNDYKSGKGKQIIMKRKKNAGKGEPIFVPKSIYDGMFVEGQRCGQGTEETQNGVYKGEWRNGVKCGQGIMTYKNGDRYEGQWDNNQFNGKGVYYQKGNCVYQGEFQAGKYHGDGKMEYQNGDRYEGQYKNGKKDGQGIYTWSDGDYYDGQWKNDSAEGRGTSMIGTDFYDGEFSNGRKHGEGELTDEQGNVLKAMWQKNEIVKKISLNGEPF